MREMTNIAKAAKRKENQATNRDIQTAFKAREPIGTVVGNKQRVEEYKNRLLAAPVAETMIRKLIEIAQNDDHPGQMAALKMAVDRILPASVFEAKKDGSRVAVNITISGLGDTVIDDTDDITDV